MLLFHYVYTTGQNFSKVLPETREDGAMKSCSVRESKIIAQFFPTLIHVPALSPVLEDKDSH